MPPRRANAIRRFLTRHRFDALFGVSVLVTVALGLWWSVFIMASINAKRDHDLRSLAYEAQIAAIQLGHGADHPALGTLPSHEDLIIVSSAEPRPIRYVIDPNWPQYAVAVDPTSLSAIDEKYQRQMLMWIGEGSTLLILIAVSLFTLYRLFSTEQRVRREMDRFVDFVTHELKTPLAGVRSLLQSFAMGRVPAQDTERLSRMGMANIDRLEHLVENILMRNRLRSHRQTMQIEPVDLRAEVAKVVAHRIDANLSREATSLEEGDTVGAMADRQALRVILDNLLDNAEKYGGKEAIRLRVDVVERKARVAIIDQGQGIAPECLPEIFEPYVRADDTDAPHRRGTGLGLALCRDLARGMGGDVRADSEGPGRGARFELFLRRADG
ncbi:HAMP domain-containing histidine kinase [bacterium]|nr:HAMP domain-containing histidine kinase [bacterium]MCB9476379.1 HAMP domain-containing histidine kinase [Deltaproteobacteria bacterium]MCB9478354.1 HAMP domain-containing histidine kinase [Deltaproteobacteria bacterium]